MVTITLAPESIATIDRRRGKLSRGEYIELLLETAGGPIVHDSEFGTRGWATLRSVRRRKK
jgi:hypothetical protein